MLKTETRYRARVARYFAAVCVGLWLASGPASAAHAQAASLVFLLPRDLDAQTRSSLEDALGTQLALAQVRLLILDGPSSDSALPLETRVGMSKSLAQQHSALGVLWLDVRPTDHWFVYAMDADAERVVVRPLLVRSESVPAAIETVAVIARASAEALLHGEPVLGEPVDTQALPPAIEPVREPEPEPPTAAATQPDADEHASSRLRIGLGYAGTTFAKEQLWQSGAQLSAAWMWRAGSYVGLAFTFIPAHTFGSDLKVSVQRLPFSIVYGFAFDLSRELRLDAELGPTLDLQRRHTVATPSGLAASGDKTRVLFAVSPTLRTEYALASWLGAFAGLGFDIFINDFGYISTGAAGKTLLDPHRVRLRATAGLAVLY